MRFADPYLPFCKTWTRVAAPLERESSPRSRAHKALALPEKAFQDPTINKNNGVLNTSLSRAEKCLYKLQGRAEFPAGSKVGVLWLDWEQMKWPGGCQGWEVSLPQVDPKSECRGRGQRQARAVRYFYGNTGSIWDQKAREEEPNSCSAFGFHPCSIHSLSQGRFNHQEELAAPAHSLRLTLQSMRFFQREFHGSFLPAQTAPCST